MSLKHIADSLAKHGRGPDNTLVHMSKHEVAGLQQLARAHGGTLTFNPKTGLPEAGFLDNLLGKGSSSWASPLLGAALTYFSDGAISPEMAGLGVGAVDAASSGNLGEGIATGLGAYGGAGLVNGLATAGAPDAGTADAAAADTAGSVGEAEQASPIKGGTGYTADTADMPYTDRVGRQFATQAGAAADTNPAASYADTVRAGAAAAKGAPLDFLKNNRSAALMALGPALLQGLSGGSQGPLPQQTPSGDFYFGHWNPNGTYTNTGRRPVAQGYPTATGMASGGVARSGIAQFASGGNTSTGDASNPPLGTGVTADQTMQNLLALLNQQHTASNSAYQSPITPGMMEASNAADAAARARQAANAAPQQPAIPSQNGLPGSGSDSQAVYNYLMGRGSSPYDPRNMIPLAGDSTTAHPGTGTAAPASPTTAGGGAATPPPAGGQGAASEATSYGGTGNPSQSYTDAQRQGNADAVSAYFSPVTSWFSALMDGSAGAANDPKLAPKAGDTSGDSAGTGSVSGQTITDANGNPISAGITGSYNQTYTPGDTPSGETPHTTGEAHGGLLHERYANGGSLNARGNFYGLNGVDRFHGPKVYRDQAPSVAPAPAAYAHGGIAALHDGFVSHLGSYSDGGRLLKGPGDGVSDDIPATIGHGTPARLADGEFVIPARIVSELGNGSTDAGAKRLYQMMARVQAGRKKTIGKNAVATDTKAEKHLPA